MKTHGPLFGAIVALFILGACAPDPAAEDKGLPVLVRSSIPSNVSLQALAQGRLHLDPDGCLRVGENGPFVIWPHDSRIARTADGQVQVTDGPTGNAVRVGQQFAIAGAGVDVAPSQLTQPVPPACARGKFWLGGPVMSEADRLAMLSRQGQMKVGGRPSPTERP